MAQRIFALNFNTGEISGSPTTFSSYTVKPFTNGDKDTFQVYIVQTGILGSLTSINTTGQTLKVALGLHGQTPSAVYASVTLTSAAAGAYFSGTLPLNVAAVAALFAAQGEDVTVDLEFELTDVDGNTQTIRIQTTIRQQIITSALQDTQPPDTAIGEAAANARFVPIVETVSIPRIMVDQNGTGQKYLHYILDGVPRYDPIA